jgi:hypothetical protein
MDKSNDARANDGGVSIPGSDRIAAGFLVWTVQSAREAKHKSAVVARIGIGFVLGL